MNESQLVVSNKMNEPDCYRVKWAEYSRDHQDMSFVFAFVATNSKSTMPDRDGLQKVQEALLN
jgi:hypothetical protein